jgi:FKBP-type peptidyl-prolyl cis-trans isomerase 2
MKIEDGSIVRIEFEIRVKGGEVLESSEKTGPIEYVQGEGKMLPALEKRLLGIEAGKSLEGEIPAAEVAPPEDSLPTRAIPRKEFPKEAKLEVGMMFEAGVPGGGVINMKIIEVDDETVTTRLLPALAGKDLTFKVKVIRIEDPVKHQVSMVKKPPPPLPAAAVKTELEADLEPDE